MQQHTILSESITSISLKNRLSSNNVSKVILHNIQILPANKEAMEHFKYLKASSNKFYYLPSLTMEYVYHKIFDDALRKLWDLYLHSSEENGFIVYFTDSENYLYYFISSEQIIGLDKSKFDFKNKENLIFS